MTLSEMSKDYEASAQLLRDRLRELRTQLAQTDDPEEAWHLKRRIAELTPMLTQMYDLAWMLSRYYIRGGSDRDDRYGFNGFHRIRKIKHQTDENLDKHTAKRINRFAAGNILGLSLPEENNSTDCDGTISAQKLGQSLLEASGAESTEIHEIFANVGKSFPRYKKK